MSFKPTLLPYNSVGRFRFWSQKVLPTIYDDSLSYYEVLTKLTNYLNSFIENIETMQTNIDTINDAFGDLEESLTEDIEDFKAEVQETLDGYLDDLNDYKDDINEDINAFKDDVNDTVDDFIETVNGTLQQYDTKFENFKTTVLNSINGVGFVPVMWGGTSDAEHYNYTYNDGSEDATEQPVDTVTPQSYVADSYTNDNGNRNPAVYFSIADNYRREMNEGDPRYENAYILIKSDEDISGRIYISENYNVQTASSNAIGMRFDIQAGISYLPFKIDTVVGSPNGKVGNWLGIEFEEYGNVAITVGMVYATKNSTSIYYTGASSFAELYTSILNDMIGQLNYLPIDDEISDGVYILRQNNGKLSLTGFYYGYPHVDDNTVINYLVYDPDEPSPHVKWDTANTILDSTVKVDSNGMFYVTT